MPRPDMPLLENTANGNVAAEKTRDLPDVFVTQKVMMPDVLR